MAFMSISRRVRRREPSAGAVGLVEGLGSACRLTQNGALATSPASRSRIGVGLQSRREPRAQGAGRK
jgi:hypothetical protein